MHAMNAYALARLMASRRDLMEFSLSSSSLSSDEVSFGTFWWFAFAGTSLFLVLFAGIMSGLTLGLMSLGIVDLEILQRSGTPTEKKQACKYRLSFWRRFRILLYQKFKILCVLLRIPHFAEFIYCTRMEFGFRFPL